jgi:3-deoxy-D-manno-octulosonate 8-phosphate phosphatase (KDO 8-P phosphatase)
MLTLEERLARSKIFFTDVDGVHTDDRVLIMETNGALAALKGTSALRMIPCDALGNPQINTVDYFALRAESTIAEGYRFCTKDGIAALECLRHDIPFVMMTGRRSPAVRQRAEDLKVTCRLGVKDKVAEVEVILKEKGIIDHKGVPDWSMAVVMGNDVQDLSYMKLAGVAIAPADAVPEVRAVAHFVTGARGGYGAVREAVEAMLKAKGLWSSIISRERTLG